MLKNLKNQRVATNRGITLIALVATIVILLILAGITINAILSEGGILNTAKRAENVQQEATLKETVQVMLADAKLKEKTENKSLSEYLGEEDYTIKNETEETITIEEDGYEITIDKATYQITGITKGEGDTNPPEEKPQVADLVDQDASQTNTYAQDKYGNSIVIPAGFKVLANGVQNTVYDYDKNEEGTSTGEPVVQDGIVIKHATDGNEFVWVPVGEIYNDLAGENITNIKLGRYNHFGNGFTMDTTTTPPTPPSPKQEASTTGYDTTTAEDVIGTSPYQYFENSTGTYEGTQYKSTGNFETLGSWISNTIDNGGYYIARYEASYGTDGKANSKPSEGTPREASTTEIEEGMLWNFVTQIEASTASKAMYTAEENLGYYSELVNSYAKDTLIIFIQTYSENADYSQKYVYNGNYSLQNTGEREQLPDKECNLYDVAYNLNEWTTETCFYADYPYVYRGGLLITTDDVMALRAKATYSYSSSALGFRTLLDCHAEN